MANLSGRLGRRERRIRPEGAGESGLPLLLRTGEHLPVHFSTETDAGVVPYSSRGETGQRRHPSGIPERYDSAPSDKRRADEGADSGAVREDAQQGHILPDTAETKEAVGF